MHSLFRKWRQFFSSPGSNPYPLHSTGGRISLQPFQSHNVKLVEDWLNDRKTCELAFGVKAPWEVLSTIRSEYIEELQRDTIGVLSIVSNQTPIGFVRYKLFHKSKRKLARVGIVLGPASARGQGLGREAFQTLVDYLFQHRQVTQIELDTATFNKKAQACFEACGFRPIREVEFNSINAQWTEKRLLMQISREEWEAG